MTEQGAYTHTIQTRGGGTRTYKLYGCAKRGCDRINTDYEAFGASNGKSYCRTRRCIPWRSRLRLRWQERRP